LVELTTLDHPEASKRDSVNTVFWNTQERVTVDDTSIENAFEFAELDF